MKKNMKNIFASLPPPPPPPPPAASAAPSKKVETKPFDFSSFMKTSAHSEAQKVTDVSFEKKEVKKGFDQVKNKIPTAATNFEKTTASTNKSNMANILSSLPPPPPPP